MGALEIIGIIVVSLGFLGLIASSFVKAIRSTWSWVISIVLVVIGTVLLLIV